MDRFIDHGSYAYLRSMGLMDFSMNPPTSSVHLQKLKTIEFMTREDFFKKSCSENPYKEQGRIINN